MVPGSKVLGSVEPRAEVQETSVRENDDVINEKYLMDQWDNRRSAEGTNI